MVPGGCGNKKVNGTGRWGNFTIHMAPGMVLIFKKSNDDEVYTL